MNDSKIYVHLDDDDLILMFWKMSAKEKGLKLKSFSKVDELFLDLKNIPKDSHFYIDFNLSDQSRNGMDVAKSLYEKGFRFLSLTTGHDASRFSEYDFLTSVIGKKPPWK